VFPVGSEILSEGDGTLSTKYRLRSDWRKPQEGLTFSRANRANISSSRNCTKSRFLLFYSVRGQLAYMIVLLIVMKSLIFMQRLLQKAAAAKHREVQV
jgi:hypothetical protein